MRQRNAVRVGRAMGGAVAALAVIPWLGAGTALASPSTDGDCATRPNGVAASATCSVFGGSAGEVWATRSTANELKVKVYLVSGLASGDTIKLCVTKDGAFAPGSTCSAGAVATSTDPTINYPLGASFIGESDPVWYAVTAGNSDGNVTALGQGPAVPSPSPSPTSTSGSPSPSVSPTDTTTPSPSVSPTDTTTPSPSVSPTESTSPSVSVLPTKIQGSSPAVDGLAHTGGGGEMGTALASLALLGVGGALVVGAQARRAPARRH